MKLKVKIKTSDLKHFNNAFTTIINGIVKEENDKIDYADFYNASTFLKQIADKMYKNNFSFSALTTLSINLNEYRTLKKMSEEINLYCRDTISYSSMLITFFNDCEKQLSNFQHHQNIFFKKLSDHQLQLPN